MNVFDFRRFLLQKHRQTMSTLVYTRLVTSLHSSTFVYIRLWLAYYIRLHSSSDSSVFLE